MILHSRMNAASGRPRMLALLLCALLVFCAGACAKRSRSSPTTTESVTTSEASSSFSATQRININVAPAKELEALPGIGKGLAERIVEHREKYGPFRRVEHLMMVRGISETRFRALRHLVTVE